MGLIKEPLNVDFYCSGKEMTEEDQKRVSTYILQQKDIKNKAIQKSKKKNKQNA